MDKTAIIKQMYEEIDDLRDKSGLSKRQLSLDIGKSENWYQQSLKKEIDIPYSDVILMKDVLNKAIADKEKS